MKKNTRYTFGKKDKLKSRKTIDQLFTDGKSFTVFPFRVLYNETPIANSSLTAAFAVSKKHFKKAIDRNRIKRLMREAWRTQKNILQEKIESKNYAIFIIYNFAEMPTYNFVVEKTATIINRLLKIFS